MPLAASGAGNNGNEAAATLDSQAQQQQHHQQAMMAQAAVAYSQPSMAGHGSSASTAELAGTGFQSSGSGMSHMQSNSVSSIDSSASLQHDAHTAAALSMPGGANDYGQQQQPYPYTGELQAYNNAAAQQHQAPQQQQHPASVPSSNFMFNNVSSNPAISQQQLSFNGTPQQSQFQSPTMQPIQPTAAAQQQASHHLQHQHQQAQQPQMVFQHDPSTGSSSTRSSPVVSTAALDTPTVGSSMSGPFAFPSSSTNTTPVANGHANSAPATASASNAPGSFISSLANTPLGSSGAIPGGAENVGQQQQQTMQQNMPSTNPSSATGTANSSLQSSPIDAAPSSSGLTLGQMEPQFSLQQLQQQQQEQQGLHHQQLQSLGAAQPLMVHEHITPAQGQELAVKACADVSSVVFSMSLSQHLLWSYADSNPSSFATALKQLQQNCRCSTSIHSD